MRVQPGPLSYAAGAGRIIDENPGALTPGSEFSRWCPESRPTHAVENCLLFRITGKNIHNPGMVLQVFITRNPETVLGKDGKVGGKFSLAAAHIFLIPNHPP